jgi:hypothetical protein
MLLPRMVDELHKRYSTQAKKSMRQRRPGFRRSNPTWAIVRQRSYSTLMAWHRALSTIAAALCRSFTHSDRGACAKSIGVPGRRNSFPMLQVCKKQQRTWPPYYSYSADAEHACLGRSKRRRCCQVSARHDHPLPVHASTSESPGNPSSSYTPAAHPPTRSSRLSTRSVAPACGR